MGVVTASLNPRDHYGFMLTLAGRTLHGDDLQEMRRRIEAGGFVEAPARGSAGRIDVLGAYRDRIAGDIRLARKKKVVIDCGNGVAGASTPHVLRAIGCEVVELFCEV